MVHQTLHQGLQTGESSSCLYTNYVCSGQGTQKHHYCSLMRATVSVMDGELEDIQSFLLCYTNQLITIQLYRQFGGCSLWCCCVSRVLSTKCTHQ